MGMFRERDRREEQDFSVLDRLEDSETARTSEDGRLDFTGLDEAVSRIRSNDSGGGEPLEQPEKVLDDREIDYESIKTWANHAYFVNSNDHIPTPENKELDIGITTHYEEMTDALMVYLQDDGIEGLRTYVSGDLEDRNHWANLVGFGLVEGEEELSNLGEYVTDQVFQYSDR